MAENGINLVRPTANKEALDLVEDAGLHAWLNTGNLIDFLKDGVNRREQLTDLVNRLKDHPALAVWEVPDDALWSLGYPGLEDLFYGLNGMHLSNERQDSLELWQ